MSETGEPASRPGEPVSAWPDPSFTAMLEDNTDDLYDNAPCGYLSTLLDGTIAKVNATLLGWLGYHRDELVGRRPFADLLTVGGRLYHETHYAPLLLMQGEIRGIALDLRAADGSRLPVMVTSTVKTGGDGQPLLIRTTVFDARDRRAYETELLRARQESERERERLKRLNVTLQRTLLPPALADVPGLDVAAYYHMASPDEVGGDFYDLVPLADGRWGFFLGDVCGKGVDAAAVTAAARYTLRAAAVYDPTPAAVLANLNAVLYQDDLSDTHRYCTVIFGVLTAEPTGYTATLASGGHPPALLIRADGTADYQPTRGGTIVGVLPDAPFVTRTIPLGPGDTLLLYTDGLTEARTGTDTRFGADSLQTFASHLPAGTATDLVRRLTELLNTFDNGPDDDVALMALSIPVTPSAEGDG